MGARDRLTRALAPGLVLLLLSCTKKESRQERIAPPHQARVDALAPGEIAEGPEELWKLRLPMGSRIYQRLGNLTVVLVPQVPTKLDAYLERRLVGPSTVKDGVRKWRTATVKGGDPMQALDVTLARSSDPDFKSELRIDAIPKSTLPATASTEERWRAVGVTPDGQLLNKNRE